MTGFPSDIQRLCIIAAGNKEIQKTFDLIVTLKEPNNLRYKKEVLDNAKKFNFNKQLNHHDMAIYVVLNHSFLALIKKKNVFSA